MKWCISIFVSYISSFCNYYFSPIGCAQLQNNSTAVVNNIQHKKRWLRLFKESDKQHKQVKNNAIAEQNEIDGKRNDNTLAAQYVLY